MKWGDESRGEGRILHGGNEKGGRERRGKERGCALTVYFYLQSSHREHLALVSPARFFPQFLPFAAI